MTDAQLIGLNLQVEKLNRLKEDLTCLCPVAGVPDFSGHVARTLPHFGFTQAHSSRKGSDDLRPVSSNF